VPDTGWNDDALVRRIDMVDFLKEAEGIEQEVIGWRRHVHQYPELLMDLPETAAFVERELKNMGYEPEYICQSGIVAVLDSQKPGKTLLLRADMDALPIGEESGLEYASKHPGISHACGHDTHIAMLLGAAKLLMKHKDLLRGKVKFMFQPGEEGGGGARTMVEAGVLRSPDVDACMAFHQVVARDHVPTGIIGYTRGPMMASADMFRITVRGKSAHGASPESGVNPVQILCQIYNGLQSIECSEKPRGSALALTIGQISAGRAGNVIPEQGFMCGSIRAYEENVRSLAKRRLKEISEQTAAMYGGRAEVEFPSELPATVNDLQVGDEMFGYVKELVGEEGTMMLPQIMGGEDFAEVLKEAPGVLFRVSLGDKQEGYPYISHNSKVIFNESGMKHAVAAFAHCAVRWLNAH
jgi:amidohydrolase